MKIKLKNGMEWSLNQDDPNYKRWTHIRQICEDNKISIDMIYYDTIINNEPSRHIIFKEFPLISNVPIFKGYFSSNKVVLTNNTNGSVEILLLGLIIDDFVYIQHYLKSNYQLINTEIRPLDKVHKDCIIEKKYE